METQTIPRSSAQETPAQAVISSLRAKVLVSIEEQRERVVQLSHDIHDHPELAFTEEFAAERISSVLANEGFSVRKGVYGLPTAFVAKTGNGPLHIAFCAEYDALPPACLGAVSSGSTSSEQNKLRLAEVWLGRESVGHEHQDGQDAPPRHGCGHNLIAGAAVAAILGLRDVADEAGLTVSIYGTPGEELCGLPEPPKGHLAGGKVELLKAGAFDGVHAVLMMHPGPTPWSMFYPTHVYLRQRARFSSSRAKRGKACGDVGAGLDMDMSAGQHSMGVAELRLLKDALQRTILAVHQVPALFVARPERQTERRGADVREATAGKCDWEADAQAEILWIAAANEDGMRGSEAVRRCFEEVAASMGVQVEITEYAVDGELHNDPMLSALYRENSRVLGRIRERDEHVQEEIRDILSSPGLPLSTHLMAPLLRLFPHLIAPPGLFMDRCPVKFIFGTDLAPVSEVIPCIQPLVGVGGTAGVHSVEFAEQADTQEAYAAMLDAGIALAWTALGAATSPILRAYLLDRGSQSRGDQNQ